jgi:hypothetical protein
VIVFAPEPPKDPDTGDPVYFDWHVYLVPHGDTDVELAVTR